MDARRFRFALAVKGLRGTLEPCAKNAGSEKTGSTPGVYAMTVGQ